MAVLPTNRCERGSYMLRNRVMNGALTLSVSGRSRRRTIQLAGRHAAGRARTLPARPRPALRRRPGHGLIGNGDDSRLDGETPKLFGTIIHVEEQGMSKGMDSKKSEKKKPAKTLKEKRAAKQEKKKDK